MRKFKKGLLLVVMLISLISITSCTENQRAKQLGGSTTYDIPASRKFVNATWKDDNLWIITRNRVTTDTKEVYYFSEKSSYGLMEGNITFIEK